MKKIRWQNDIDILWHILDSGNEPYNLEGRDLTLTLVLSGTRTVVEDYSVTGNTISFTYFGKDQTTTGKVALILSENAGQEGMHTIDIVDALVLVPHTFLEGGEDACSHIETETVELTTSTNIGMRGYSAYEIAVQEGFVGTVDEWLASLKGDPGTTDYNELENKPDLTIYQQKVEGKGLSENDYTDAEKQKLADLPNKSALDMALAGKYEKPGTGIPKTDLAEGVQASLGKADTALQEHQDISGKANKSEMSVSESGDKTTITLKSGLSAEVINQHQSLTHITDLIPEQASPENQLADKEFVNSSIETNTASFKGTYNLVSDLSLTIAATASQIATALGSVVSGADNNDYAFVQIPTADATPLEIARVDRFKYNGAAWAYEWSLNNSSFTAAQWAALNSGITSGLVGKLSDLPTAIQLETSFGGKVDKVNGKGLSTEDYTTDEKTKLGTIAANAQVNAIEGVQVNGTDITPDGNKKVNVQVPTTLAGLSEDTTHRVVTDTEKTTWNGKQDTISDLSNIRSGAEAGASAYQKPPGGIPSTDIAPGVIPDVSGKENAANKVSGWQSTPDNIHYPAEKLVKDSLDGKQATLVSGTNIKTINNQSILGPGDITIQGGGGTKDYAENDPENAAYINNRPGGYDYTLYNDDIEYDGVTLVRQSADDGYIVESIIPETGDGATLHAIAERGYTIPCTYVPSDGTMQGQTVNGTIFYDVEGEGLELTTATGDDSTEASDITIDPADIPGGILVEDVYHYPIKFPSKYIPSDAAKEDKTNKVNSLSSASTDQQYPSAKAVYDALYENVFISLGVNSAGTASDLIGLKVTVTNADTSEQISEQTWNGTPLVVRIKAGVRYTVSVQTHPDYVTPASQTFTAELASTRSVGFIYVYSAVIDLSYRDTDGTKKMVRDTANSYVARVAGDYKLPAVYGNAIKNGATNSAAYTRQGSTYTADFVNYKGVQITSPYIETDTGETIASAVLLWQTGANLISNVAFANGYVTFTVNSIPTENGLAVLAVKDGNGDIMWSWTIWLTTDTLTAERFTNHTEVDYYLMPENLFCIWNEQRTNYGTAMIQWGRKDVMVPNTPGGSSQMTVYDIEGNAITAGTALGSVIGVFGSENDQSADKTVANSIKNPGMFFTRYDSTNNNWNSLAWFNNFWNAAETSSASSADNQDTAIKTIYDPCPFGWMLPAGRAFTGFTTTGAGTSTASQFNVVGSWSNGWNFKRNSEDTTGNKFIASGHRASGSGALTLVGSNGIYWSFAPNSQANARDLYVNSGNVDPQNSYGRSYGFAVRPSRE